jgi:hypothetical protein
MIELPNRKFLQVRKLHAAPLVETAAARECHKGTPSFGQLAGQGGWN